MNYDTAGNLNIYCPSCSDGTAVVVHRNGERCPSTYQEEIMQQQPEVNVNINLNFKYCPNCGHKMGE